MNKLNAPDLSAAGVLVYVQIRGWSARKLDRKQTEKTVADASALTTDAARVNKHLLAGADDKLKAVTRKGNEIRDYVDANTLPWDNAGYRLLDNAKSLTVIAAVAGKIKEYKDIVDEFVAEYPVLRAQALANLGDMADSSDYPPPDVVRSRFGVEVTYHPIATNYGSGRSGMADAVTAILQSNYKALLQQHEQRAVHSALERLRDNLQRYVDRLTPGADGKRGRFTESMVAQLNDTLDMITSLGMDSADQRTAQLVDVIRNEIAVYSVENLRADESCADNACTTAENMLSAMSQWL